MTELDKEKKERQKEGERKTDRLTVRKPVMSVGKNYQGCNLQFYGKNFFLQKFGLVAMKQHFLRLLMEYNSTELGRLKAGTVKKTTFRIMLQLGL